MVQTKAAGQKYKQLLSFTYLGGAVTEVPDMSVEIARRTRAWWMRIRRCLRELYDQPKVALSLKTQMVKAEAIEALFYGCSTWTLRRMTSYNRALEITGCESIETTLRMRRLL